MSVAAVIFN